MYRSLHRRSLQKKRFSSGSRPTYFVMLLCILLTACVPAQSITFSASPAEEEPTATVVPTKRPLQETAASPAHPKTTVTPENNQPTPYKPSGTAVPHQVSVLSASAATAHDDGLYYLPLTGEMNVDWVISNYVDHDWEAYQSEDYNHGSMTYDGHTGTDFLLRDLAQMDEGVSVLAARAGHVTNLYDSANDREWMGTESNFITIEHADGSVATYQHLRQHSVQVAIGDRVKVGQPIALVGNSGNSGNPHLHFEVRSANGRLIDIFHEGLTAFDYPYPEKPYVFQAGVTQLANPAIHNDMFRYTPETVTRLPITASPTFWYKAVNVQSKDRLRSILVYPDGTEQELFTLQASQDTSVISWYIYVNPLPVGWYSVWYFFNDDTSNIEYLSFQVVP